MSKADELPVAEETWKAAIPVQIKLADSDISSMEQPPTLYFLVPRHSYLHSVLPQALRMLQHLLPLGELTPWFEHERLPLKWGVPAGVLYDLISPRASLAPWPLTVNFRAYPSAMLAPYDGEQALQASFFNSLKEAAFIGRGSSMRVMEMSGGAQQDLWGAVLQGALPAYTQIVQSLQLMPVSLRGRAPCIPLRLFVRRGGRGTYLTSYEGISYTSRPVECQTAEGAAVSLQQALLPLVAECLQHWGSAQGSSSGAPAPGSTGGGSSSNTTSQQQQQQTDEQEQATAGVDSAPSTPLVVESSTEAAATGPQAPASADAEPAIAAAEIAAPPGPVQQEAGPSSRLAAAQAAMQEVVVAGIRPPLETPLAWLHARLASADQFLYIVVHVQS